MIKKISKLCSILKGNECYGIGSISGGEVCNFVNRMVKKASLRR